MDKIKAIYRIICSKHFYLITTDNEMNCKEIHTKNTDEYQISSMIQLYWNFYWKGIFLSKPGNEKFI